MGTSAAFRSLDELLKSSSAFKLTRDVPVGSGMELLL